MTQSAPSIIRHVPAGQLCCDPQWEDAYKRFETPAEELAKFIKRLTKFDFDSMDKDARIAEVFCGRGVGLKALEQMGFQNIEGVDLSDTLLEDYRGPATLHLADCMDLPLETGAYDVVIVQGGLHHLPTLPGDLDRTLAGIRRILAPEGRFYAIEPWETPFLTFVHAVVANQLVRKLYAKGDALAAMIDRERETYEQWLRQPSDVLEVFQEHFHTEHQEIGWGKLAYVGRPKEDAAGPR